jgi:hypothetical protein
MVGLGGKEREKRENECRENEEKEGGIITMTG